MAHWSPPAGMTALVEPMEPAPGQEALTATVLDDERLVLDLGASPHPDLALDVVASFFTPDALMRVTGVLVPEGEQGIFELVVKDVERVQRRRTPRLAITLSASVIVPDAAGPFVSVLARTRDVSVGGCCVVTERPLPGGGDAMISLDLADDGAPVVAQASVLARDRIGASWRYRMIFTAIDEGDRDRLSRLTAA